jgi:molecular chaperone GrpE
MSELPPVQPESPANPAGEAAPDNVVPVPGSIEDLAARLAAAEARAAAAQDQTLRAVAEQENIRRRAAREVEQARNCAVERFVKELLPVSDSLLLAGAQQNADARSLLEGQQATLRLLEKAFESAGLQPVDPTGQPFNPEHHEAMVAQPTSEVPPDTVIMVVQRGWLLHGRLERPARVIVARAP